MIDFMLHTISTSVIVFNYTLYILIEKFAEVISTYVRT